MSKLSLFFTALCLSVLTSRINAQTGFDLGMPDTIRFELSVDYAVRNEVKLSGRLFFFNDGQDIIGAGVGFGWESPNLRMDSARMTPVALSAFDSGHSLLKDNDITITNRDRLFKFLGITITGIGLERKNRAQHVATYWFTYSSTMTGPVCVDTMPVAGIVNVEFADAELRGYSPIVTDKECAEFIDYDDDQIIDLVDNCPGVFNPDQFDDDGDGIGNVCDSIFSPCGDANGSGSVTFSDLDFLVNFYFTSGDSPLSVVVADVTGDGLFDLSDIVFLANYLNGIGPAPCTFSEPPPNLDPKEKPDQLGIGQE